MQRPLAPVGRRVRITWTEDEPYSAVVQNVASSQYLAVTPDGRNFLIPSSAVVEPAGTAPVEPSFRLDYEDPAWGSVSGTVSSFSTRQDVTTTGDQLDMILDGKLGTLVGATFIQGEHEGLALLRSATVVVHASVERGELRASVELPSGRIQGALGSRGRPITFVTEAALSDRFLRVKIEAVAGEVSNIVYSVRVTSP
jgi:hypothetical protein